MEFVRRNHSLTPAKNQNLRKSFYHLESRRFRNRDALLVEIPRCAVRGHRCARRVSVADGTGRDAVAAFGCRDSGLGARCVCERGG